MAHLLDTFIPDPDAGGRHSIKIHAPAVLVMDVARHFDMQSILLARMIFRLRAVLMRSKNNSGEHAKKQSPETLLEEGWGLLDEKPGRHFIAGAICQPWQADVRFVPLSPDQFAADRTPDHVKIAWTLEAEELEPEFTIFSTETRAKANDDQAKEQFRRYWRKFGVGIIAIRWLVLPAIRHTAEKQWKEISLHKTPDKIAFK